jgi:hypothetical protein
MNIIRTRTYTRFKVTLVVFVLCWSGPSMLSKQHGDRQVCRRNTFVNRGTACLSQGCHGPVLLACPCVVTGSALLGCLGSASVTGYIMWRGLFWM